MSKRDKAEISEKLVSIHAAAAARKKLPLNHPSRRGQSGATTGEYIFWSVLAAGVLIISLSMYFKGNSSGNAQALVKDFTTMASDAGQTYAGSWATFTTANADNAGVFQGYTSFTDNGAGSITVNDGGGVLTVAPGTLATANDSGQYTITQLDQATCKTFTAAVQKAAGSVTVNSTVVKAYGGAFSPNLMQCKATANTVVVTRSS